MQRLLLRPPAPSISLAALLLAFPAAPASAHSNGVAPSAVAESATGIATSHDPAAFTLIEHGSRPHPTHQLADQRPQGSAPASSSVAGTMQSARRPRSSRARDRVILHIHAAERRHGLPIGLLDALVAAESGYRPNAVSRAGAAGLGQLMPATARSLGVADRFDVRANLDGAARYLRSMIDRFGSITNALAAYNAGPGAVLRVGGIPNNGETRGYVKRVLRYWSERRS